jgi:hypothetical protein
MKVDSVYKIKKEINDDLLHTGYDFKGKLFVRNMDNNLFKTKLLREFLIRIEKIVQLWFDESRKIKLFRQIALDKNDTKINL